MNNVFFPATVALASIAVTETVLFVCWRRYGDKGPYLWYSCLLRTLAYAPCLVAEGHALTPLPVGAALVLHLQGMVGDIFWLYGVPEVLVAIICFLFSFGIRELAIPPK